MDFKHAVVFDYEKCNKIIKKSGLSLTQIAFIANLSYSHLSKIVTGFFPCRNLNTINKIASALDVNPNEFLKIY